MIVPSGIVLPGDEPLRLHKIMEGLYLAPHAYHHDLDYFEGPLLFPKEPEVSEGESQAKEETE